MINEEKKSTETEIESDFMLLTTNGTLIEVAKPIDH